MRLRTAPRPRRRAPSRRLCRARHGGALLRRGRRRALRAREGTSSNGRRPARARCRRAIAPAALRDDAVHRREAEARALADRLRREEGLEDASEVASGPSPRRCLCTEDPHHSPVCTSRRSRDVLPSSSHVRGLDASACRRSRHGVTGVHREVHQHLLDLSVGSNAHRPQPLGERRPQRDVLVDRALRRAASPRVAAPSR